VRDRGGQTDGQIGRRQTERQTDMQTNTGHIQENLVYLVVLVIITDGFLPSHYQVSGVKLVWLGALPDANGMIT